MPLSSQHYAGRLAVITGASSGLGRVFAEQYAAMGADVALVARRREKLEDIAHGLETACGVKALVIAQDLCEVDAHLPVMGALTKAGRHADIVVNNAGFSIPKTYADTDWAQQRDFVRTLVMAVSGLTHATLPAMLSQRWGRIINISSMVAFAPGGVGHTLYPAAKAYVLRFSQSLHQELHGTGVHCTASCPGSTRTGFRKASGIKDSAAGPSFLEQTPEKVVAGALKASEAGKAVHVPGWHNKLAVSAMQWLPDGLISPLIRRASAKLVE